MGGVQISIGGRLEKIQKITGGKEIERRGGGGRFLWHSRVRSDIKA